MAANRAAQVRLSIGIAELNATANFSARGPLRLEMKDCCQSKQKRLARAPAFVDAMEKALALKLVGKLMSIHQDGRSARTERNHPITPGLHDLVVNGVRWGE